MPTIQGCVSTIPKYLCFYNVDSAEEDDGQTVDEQARPRATSPTIDDQQLLFAEDDGGTTQNTTL